MAWIRWRGLAHSGCPTEPAPAGLPGRMRKSAGPKPRAPKIIIWWLPRCASARFRLDGRRERLGFVYDVGHKYPAFRFRWLAASVWRFGRDLERITRFEYTQRLSLYRKLKRSFHDVTRLNSRMRVARNFRSRRYASRWMRLNGPLRPDSRIRNPRLSGHFHPMVKIFEFCIPMARTQVLAGAHELAVDDEH